MHTFIAYTPRGVHEFQPTHTHPLNSAHRIWFLFSFLFPSFFRLLLHLSSEFSADIIRNLAFSWNESIILMHGYYVPSSVHANYTAHIHIHSAINQTHSSLFLPLPASALCCTYCQETETAQPKKKGILLLLAIGFSFCACVSVCVCDVYVYVYVACVYVCLCVWARLRKAICHALPVKLNAVEHF